MRAPFQILAIPYRFVEGDVQFCVFRRADGDQWQFIAGGGEDAETPLEAARREIREESGVEAASILPLSSICSIPTNHFSDKHRYSWPKDTYVVPEYAFAFECKGEITLSREHEECEWLSYEEATRTLVWDSNRTAMYELRCRLQAAQRDASSKNA